MTAGITLAEASEILIGIADKHERTGIEAQIRTAAVRLWEHSPEGAAQREAEGGEADVTLAEALDGLALLAEALPPALTGDRIGYSDDARTILCTLERLRQLSTLERLRQLSIQRAEWAEEDA